MNTDNIQMNPFSKPVTNVFNGNVNVEQLFESAIDQANLGHVLKAKEMAREALIFSKRQKQYVSVYIHSFLAVLSMDYSQYDSARIHVYSALNLLNENHFAYQTDKQYLDALHARIKKKIKVEEHAMMPALAA